MFRPKWACSKNLGRPTAHVTCLQRGTDMWGLRPHGLSPLLFLGSRRRRRWAWSRRSQPRRQAQDLIDVEYLIQNGARTVYVILIREVYDSVIKIHNVNVVNLEKNTPLHWACLNGHIEIIKALICSGASVSALNSGESRLLRHGFILIISLTMDYRSAAGKPLGPVWRHIDTSSEQHTVHFSASQCRWLAHETTEPFSAGFMIATTHHSPACQALCRQVALPVCSVNRIAIGASLLISSQHRRLDLEVEEELPRKEI
ncbi:hypothetical protein GUJ93_ZPchr0007g4297 [Zizania palustris]|uniref:Uncharacterized protein n=1 Tax=Zizania palustris TaxID=103762 RepID=A0A8J5SP19_ZIZPA|nr:hypothetical protein GUJ93_ZPchr0007g4297 [Zizania palustris]